MLASLGTLGASDWHSFTMSANEKIGFGSAPHADALVLADPTGPYALALGTFALDPTPGGGSTTSRTTWPCAGPRCLRRCARQENWPLRGRCKGKVTYVDLADPNPSFNPANCSGCAVHGVAIRP